MKVGIKQVFGLWASAVLVLQRGMSLELGKSPQSERLITNNIIASLSPMLPSAHERESVLYRTDGVCVAPPQGIPVIPYRQLSLTPAAIFKRMLGPYVAKLRLTDYITGIFLESSLNRKMLTQIYAYITDFKIKVIRFCSQETLSETGCVFGAYSITDSVLTTPAENLKGRAPRPLTNRQILQHELVHAHQDLVEKTLGREAIIFKQAHWQKANKRFERLKLVMTKTLYSNKGRLTQSEKRFLRLAKKAAAAITHHDAWSRVRYSVYIHGETRSLLLDEGVDVSRFTMGDMINFNHYFADYDHLDTAKVLEVANGKQPGDLIVYLKLLNPLVFIEHLFKLVLGMLSDVPSQALAKEIPAHVRQFFPGKLYRFFFKEMYQLEKTNQLKIDKKMTSIANKHSINQHQPGHTVWPDINRAYQHLLDGDAKAAIDVLNGIKAKRYFIPYDLALTDVISQRRLKGRHHLPNGETYLDRREVNFEVNRLYGIAYYQLGNHDYSSQYLSSVSDKPITYGLGRQPMLAAIQAVNIMRLYSNTNVPIVRPEDDDINDQDLVLWAQQQSQILRP
ncbi:MAG: hypothetical protein P1U63_06210 [Coxiellaceae bacterium]|nr:hypothetical protein [Coxiellaceae bacterium]